MTDVLRIAGFLMIVAGALLAGSWFIEPLRELWPLLLELPLPVRIGLAVSGVGLLVLFASVLHDRLRADRRSLNEDLGDDS
jgi:pilus assembly protein TadC